MNIYELEKQATSGPPGTENAQLLAHCRNNFLKALEALKASRDGLIDAKRIGQAQWIDYRIKELETVTQ